MPKYYCDYCDTYLTHDSPSVRKTHCTGRKHRDNVKFYYQKWMEEQAQSLIDATTAAFKAGKIAQNPFAPPGAPGKGMAIPPPGMPPMMMPPPPNMIGIRPPNMFMMGPPPPLGTMIPPK
ncbi:SNRPC family protein [Megaselia abdita]